MARKKATKKLVYDEIMEMAKEYGVEENALFISCANQYALQQDVIEKMKQSLDDEDNCTVEKEYVKGRANLCINPLVKELPKHSDSANRTLATMIDIINKLGHKPEQKSESLLSKLMAGEDVD